MSEKLITDLARLFSRNGKEALAAGSSRPFTGNSIAFLTEQLHTEGYTAKEMRALINSPDLSRLAQIAEQAHINYNVLPPDPEYASVPNVITAIMLELEKRDKQK